jgi:transcriptional regulator with XRE-family HTH domain
VSKLFSSAGGARAREHRDRLALLRPAQLVLDADGHVGAALRRARESLDLSLDDIAQATHVRADYLEAIENLDLSPLPARPFAVGYVRAYARALGLDPDLVAARFRHETPGEDTTLRAPLGGQFRRQTRLGRLGLAMIALIAALIGWNLIVRVSAPPPRRAAAALPAGVQPRPPAGPARLGAPLPAPPEATTPPPYVTPGLAKAAANGSDGAAGGIADEAAPVPAVNAIPIGAPFAAHGPVFGAARSSLILQAVGPMSLVVRGPGGAVYFARQLAAGEAWRAPDLAGLTADVDVPSAVEVYVAGRASGPLSQPQTPLSVLTSAKAAQPGT